MVVQQRGSHEVTMMHKFLIFLSLATVIGPVTAAPGPCNEDEPDGPQGYRTISGIMADQREEQLRIANSGQPNPPYLFNLCAGTEFNEFATNTTLIPLLDGATFICGETVSPANVCVFSGGASQVLIEDSAIQGYDIESVNFFGITFSAFSESAVAGGASSTTTVNMQSSTFAVSICLCQQPDTMFLLFTFSHTPNLCSPGFRKHVPDPTAKRSGHTL